MSREPVHGADHERALDRRERDVLRSFAILVAAIVAVWLLVGAVQAHAANFAVTNKNDAGAGSLRGAITSANAAAGADTITFSGAGASGTIQLASELPHLTGALDIRGPGANQLTVRRSSGGNYRIFTVDPNVTVTIRDLTITNGNAPAAQGGGIRNNGTLTLLRVELANNFAGLEGGGIANFNILTVRQSTVSGNFADGNEGGGIFNSSQSLTTLENSTVTGNSTADEGGGIFSDPNGALTARNSTIAANEAGSIANLFAASEADLKSTIVADPRGGGDNCSAAVTSQGFNLDSEDTCGLAQFTDRSELDPQLGPLKANGGRTRTMAPGAASPAIDRGIGDALTTDQRGTGFPRVVDIAGTSNASGGDGADIGAFERRAPILITNTNDSGVGSLREAIIEANANVGPDAITDDFGVSGTISLAGALPDLASDIAIRPGPLTVERSTGGDYRIFNITAGSVVEISQLTITNGAVTGSATGGGIRNAGTLRLIDSTVESNSAFRGGGIQNSGSLTVERSTLSDNTAVDVGGGIFNEGQATVRNSTVARNASTTSAGGGIRDNGALALANSTVAENTAATSANLSAPSTSVDGRTIRSTIVSDPLGGGTNCGGVFGSQGFNLDSGSSCNLGQATDQEHADPQLGPLASHGFGGPDTMAPAPGSPAIDQGVSNGLATDQRGSIFPRIVDQAGIPNVAGGDGADIGALELEDVLVTNTNNAGAGSLRQAISLANGSSFLFDTIAFAGAGASGTINLTSPLPDLLQTLTIRGPGADQLTLRRDSGGEYRIFEVPTGSIAQISGLTIANGRFINTVPGQVVGGGGIENAGFLSLSRVTMTGNTSNGFGGAIDNEGSLFVSSSRISGNSVTGSGVGGGIGSRGGTVSVSNSTVNGNSRGGMALFGTATVVDSTISGNTGAAGGGGISNAATLTLTRTTVSGNTATNSGGGIHNSAGLVLRESTVSGNSVVPGSLGGGGIRNAVAGNLTVRNSTIAGNTAAASHGGGISEAGAGVTVENSTIAANTAPTGANVHDEDGADQPSLESTIVADPLGGGADCAGGAFVSLGFNLESGTSCGLGQPTDRANADPKLSPLGQHGGPTETMVPSGASPALDGGVSNGLAIDQRARFRTTDIAGIANAAGGDGTDIGAVELRPRLVTNLANTGAGSLRQAIATANATTGANAGPDLITFSGAGAAGTINLASALPGLTSDIEIAGPGANALTVRRSSGGDYRIFEVSAGDSVGISGLTIANGSAPGDDGGGIRNLGELTVERAAISGNSARLGGGIMSRAGSRLTMRDSTVSGNTATERGGGVFNSGALTARNITIAANTATIVGGGLRAISGTATIENATFAENGARAGANLSGTSGSASLESTIVADPQGGGQNCSGAFTSQGFNLDSGSSCGLGQATDQAGGDPLLGLLQDNGGPTETMLPGAASPALDKGTSNGLGTDQRGPGFPRVVDLAGIANAAGGDGTDVGAVERAAS